MGLRVRIGESEFELDFDLSPDEPLPPGMEWVEIDTDEDSWPAGAPPELVAYAHELAISPEQVNHWIHFFTTHPQGRLAWQEIQRLWKPERRGKRRRK